MGIEGGIMKIEGQDVEERLDIAAQAEAAAALADAEVARRPPDPMPPPVPHMDSSQGGKARRRRGAKAPKVRTRQKARAGAPFEEFEEEEIVDQNGAEDQDHHQDGRPRHRHRELSVPSTLSVAHTVLPPLGCPSGPVPFPVQPRCVACP